MHTNPEGPAGNVPHFAMALSELDFPLPDYSEEPCWRGGWCGGRLRVFGVQPPNAAPH